MRKVIFLLCVFLLAGCASIGHKHTWLDNYRPPEFYENQSHKYNVWVNIVFGRTFSDMYDYCVELEEYIDGEWEGILDLEENDFGRVFNKAAYVLGAAAYNKEDCKAKARKKIKELTEKYFKKLNNYTIKWYFNYYLEEIEYIVPRGF